MKNLRILSLLTLGLLAAHLLAPVAAAHPLGNFTINHYAGLHVTRETITLDYVLDMAEIPAFQEISTFDANGNGRAEPAEIAGYDVARCESLRPDLDLRLDGQPLPLSLTSSGVEFPPGAGGLPTLRLTCNFRAPLELRGETPDLEFTNRAYARRLGWREIVVTGDGVALEGDAAVLRESVSQRLRVYPDDLLSTPLDQRQTSFRLKPAAAPDPSSAQPATAAEGAGPPPADRNDGFTRLIALQTLTVPTILLALGVAFVWGAAHALTPGHGKTIVAAYLVGSRGTVRHAIFLGLTTTLTHTAGVFALGFLTLFASQFILPEQLYPWLGVASGALVAGIGLSLLRGRLRRLLAGGDSHHHHGHGHEHPHHHRAHEHGQADHEHHDHAHGPGHTHHDHHHHAHMPPGADGRPVTWRSLLALGVSGGLIPCPSALVVMLSAIALQRIGFGLVLIVSFSLGLAGVLTAIGILWVQARRLVERLPGRGSLLGRLAGRGLLLQALPAASALLITLVGVGITLQALIRTGVLNV